MSSKERLREFYITRSLSGFGYEFFNLEIELHTILDNPSGHQIVFNLAKIAIRNVVVRNSKFGIIEGIIEFNSQLKSILLHYRKVLEQ